MAYLGDFALGATFDTKFCTVQSTGAPTTLSGVPVISAYPDNSTTEITAGITLSVDFDSRTGLNNVRVVATGANGYAAGSNYQLVITTGTVNSVSAVGYVVGEFSIQARPPQISATGATAGAGVADAGTLQSATGTTAVIRSGASATDNIYNGHTLAIISGTGAGESRIVTAYTGASKTCTVDTWTTNPDNTSLYALYLTPPASSASLMPVNVSAINSVSTSPVTTVKAVQGLTTADTIATYTGNTPQTGDSFARIGAPVGASISADIAAVKADTGSIKTQTDKLAFTVANQVDANVLDWKSSTAPAMTGDAFARLGAPAGASVSADIAAVKSDTGTTLTDAVAIKAKTDQLTFTTANHVDAGVKDINGTTVNGNGAGTPWGP